MHTVICADDRRTFRVVNESRPSESIQTFENVEEASYFCNRLNGGYSSEMAVLVMALKPILVRVLEEANNGR